LAAAVVTSTEFGARDSDGFDFEFGGSRLKNDAKQQMGHDQPRGLARVTCER
jgi:hypothetical protein